MKKFKSRKLFLNRETIKALTLRTDVQGGRQPTVDTRDIGTCSCGATCVKDKYTHCA
jgi:hypothetical protein